MNLKWDKLLNIKISLPGSFNYVYLSVHPVASVFLTLNKHLMIESTLRIKSKFSLLKNLDFLLIADTLIADTLIADTLIAFLIHLT